MSGEAAPDAPSSPENTVVGPAEMRVVGPPLTRYESSYQDPAQAQHYREMAAADAAHAREKELIELKRQGRILNAGLILLFVVAGGCLVVMLVPGYPVTTTDKALGILVAIVSGFIGYLAGQVGKK